VTGFDPVALRAAALVVSLTGVFALVGGAFALGRRRR
jgi:hypothetical protein